MGGTAGAGRQVLVSGGHKRTHAPMQRLGLRRSDVPDNSLKLFIRQPFTESGEAQQQLIQEVMWEIDAVNGSPYTFQYLAGAKAESADTFRQSFEHDQQLPFTPKNFRNHRLRLLDQADVMINIRVGMSESSAFELSYHIFKGRCTPILFLVWKQAPIKTTLLRELDDVCDVTYLEFDRADELRNGIRRFFQFETQPKCRKFSPGLT
jgi:carbamoyl-phosphate synthase large subunit